MAQLLLNLSMAGQVCLILGESKLAARKINALSKTDAVIEFYSVNPASEPIASNQLTVLDDYPDVSRKKYALIVVASEDPVLIKRAVADANANQVPINVFKQPELSTANFPYLIDRDPITIAVSSQGVSGQMTRLIQTKINALVPVQFGRLVNFFKAKSSQVNTKLTAQSDRRRFWESMVDGAIAENIYQGKEDEADKIFAMRLNNEAIAHCGEVYLIGAGPGDPDLLTFKALRLLQSADVILYDRLVNPSILDYCKPQAEKLYVGKAMSNHSVPQSEINQRLIDLAKAGKRVARLKGGDPFIFGRGGEEIEGLAEEGIPFQVIPGITAANGCSSYAGIPLTHRDFAQSVRFITGHLKEGELDLDWASFVSPEQTLVFYMGLSNLGRICEKLIAYGRAKETPVALVEKGTTPSQRLLIATLETMPEELKVASFEGPALTIVGDVVKLHEKLDWFQQ
ncbi:MAG: siroheme synthase CysG [Cellvibrionales bacterium]|nr:siroheme synthase CysG [Cellvibrionales bacterium]